MDYALNFAILKSFYGKSLKKDTNNKKHAPPVIQTGFSPLSPTQIQLDTQMSPKCHPADSQMSAQYNIVDYSITENKTYSLPFDNKSYTECIQTVSDMDTQIRLDKIRLDKNRDSSSTPVDARPRFDYQSVKKVVRFVRFAVI